jgi:hypothetical protein
VERRHRLQDLRPQRRPCRPCPGFHFTNLRCGRKLFLWVCVAQLSRLLYPMGDTEMWQMWLFDLCQESSTNKCWYRLLWNLLLRYQFKTYPANAVFMGITLCPSILFTSNYTIFLDVVACQSKKLANLSFKSTSVLLCLVRLPAKS